MRNGLISFKLSDWGSSSCIIEQLKKNFTDKNDISIKIRFNQAGLNPDLNDVTAEKRL